MQPPQQVAAVEPVGRPCYTASAQALRSKCAFLARKLLAGFARKTLHGERLTKDDHQRWQQILQAKG
ncbi:hypothetical protein ACSMXM_10970 [Pacificimonas sp. ICDLI1SI03]